MSTADHRDEALHCLDAVDVLRDNDVDGSLAHAALASEATAHALLALEARLGELIEQQRLSNTIAAFQSRAVRSDADYVQGLATVRGLLGLSTEESENR